jgi:hypothetical protein
MICLLKSCRSLLFKDIYHHKNEFLEFYNDIIYQEQNIHILKYEDICYDSLLRFANYIYVSCHFINPYESKNIIFKLCSLLSDRIYNKSIYIQSTYSYNNTTNNTNNPNNILFNESVDDAVHNTNTSQTEQNIPDSNVYTTSTTPILEVVTAQDHIQLRKEVIFKYELSKTENYFSMKRNTPNNKIINKYNKNINTTTTTTTSNNTGTNTTSRGRERLFENYSDICVSAEDTNISTSTTSRSIKSFSHKSTENLNFSGICK